MNTTNTTNCTTGTLRTSSLSGHQAIIEYKPGQWSPINKDGEKVYDRSQLFILRNSVLSKKKPPVTNPATPILRNIPSKIQNRNALMPSFATDKRLQMVGRLPMRKSASHDGTSRMSGKSSNKDSNCDMIRVSLSLCEDVKLTESKNAWRPLLLSYKTDEDTSEQLLRKVRGILNKLTPEKFEVLMEQFTSLRIDTSEKIVSVMELIFEKAIDEPKFSASYAKLCCNLIQNNLQSIDQDPNLDVFRKALLEKAQREFNENVLARNEKESQLRPITEKLEKCSDPEEVLELKSSLEEQERKLRRRFVGTVKFIGELFKINILTQKILASCIEALLDPNDEDKLECLCQLLRTVGEVFETGRSLDHTMAVMKQIVDCKGVSSRIRFMLQDVIDLRNEKWKSKAGEGLKTMKEIHKEVELENTKSRMLNYNIDANKKDEKHKKIGGGAGGSSRGSQCTDSMSSSGRYRNNNFNKNNSEHRQLNASKASTKHLVDANKLGRLIICGNENLTRLGTRSQFQWNPGEGTSRACTSSSDLVSNLNSSTGKGPENKQLSTDNSEDHIKK